MSRLAYALAALVAAGVALAGCSGLKAECTPGAVCVVTPLTAPPANREGPRVPPAPGDDPTPTKSRGKPGRKPKPSRTDTRYRTVVFKMRQVTITPRPVLTIKHRIEGRKRTVTVDGYTELGYTSEPYTLVAPGLLAWMQVTATSGTIRALECWVEIGGRVAAKSVNIGSTCEVETIVR